jgi:hypothetical protein
LSLGRRALGLGFSIASMPFEWSPLVVAAMHKRSERSRMDAYEREWLDARRRSVRPATGDGPVIADGAATEAAP